MVDLRPFCGWRYSTEKAGTIENLLAPPFDVIRGNRRQELLDSSPYNIIRLTLAGDLGGDWHEAAADRFQQWKKDEILRQDEGESFYAYEMGFDWNGRTVRRLGLLGILRLEEDEREVYPHEHTFAAPRADRLKLLAACRANLEPIFLLFPDASMEIDGTLRDAPRLDEEAAEFDESSLRFWRVGDPDAIRSIRSRLEEKNLLIADGHHRFATAKDFRDAEWKRLGRRDPEDGFNFRLVHLATIEDPGLRILPTHRTVRGLPEDRIRGLRGEIERFYEIRPEKGDIETLARPLREGDEGAPEIMVALAGETWSLFPREDGAVARAMGDDRSELWSSLPASRLHRIILSGILRIPEDRFSEIVDFHRSPSEAKDLVEGGRAQAAFFLRSIRPETVWKLSQSGEMMPQKSTDFYPKFPSGFVFYEFG